MYQSSLTRSTGNMLEGESMSDISIVGRWKRLPPKVKWPAGIVAGWLILILMIQVGNSTNQISRMPAECPEGSMNCVRIAHDGTSFNSGDLEPLSFNATKDEVLVVVENWFDERWFASVISVEDAGTSTVVHGVDHTEFWFFADDVFVEISCVDGAAELTLHSQSRLGKGDMGENHRRMTEFHEDISSEKWSNEPCEG